MRRPATLDGQRSQAALTRSRTMDANPLFPRKLCVYWLVCLVACVLLRPAHAIDIERTSGIFGAIQFVDKNTTITRLLEECFAGFLLNGCEDLNATAFRKDYSFASQFTDVAKRSQQYCLQCCTRPVPRLGADETWNLSCPLNDVQRLSVSKGRRIVRFARRNTLSDEAIVECSMPNRTLGTYLNGYTLTLWIIERTIDFGSKYWRSVVNCSITITETPTPPSKFSEVIRIRSIPTPQSRPTAWVAPTFLSLAGVLAVLSVPLYKAGYKGQRCQHCGSWLVFVNHMCIACIVVSCRLHPPPPKVYVENGDPHREPTVEEDDDGDDESSESGSDSDSDDDAKTRVYSIKNFQKTKSRRKM